MKNVIREMRLSEAALLTDFLYEAIFVPEGEAKPDRSIVNDPALQVYVRDFGGGLGDRCFVAEADGRVVGAAWSRVMDDYGHIDDDTPSLAIALYPEYRGQGLGGAMLAKLLDALREGGWTRVSLSVQKANRALRLYRRLGFVTVEDRGEELIMVRRLDGMQSPDARRRS